jgi:hypothetical protein
MATKREKKKPLQSVDQVAKALELLETTPEGREALRELVESNGDSLQVMQADGLQLQDTQFVRRFAAFAANQANSSVFKTTVANAAYRLSDLTSHLIPAGGDSCVCRGSYSDIILSAYSRTNFLSVGDEENPTEGANAIRDVAASYQAEVMLNKRNEYELTRQRYAGGVQEPIVSEEEARKASAGSGVGTIGTGLGRVPTPNAVQTTDEIAQQENAELAELDALFLQKDIEFREQEEERRRRDEEIAQQGNAERTELDALFLQKDIEAGDAFAIDPVTGDLDFSVAVDENGLPVETLPEGETSGDGEE